MLYLKHLETTRLPNKVTTNLACQISENGQISIITLNCVLVFQICAVKENNLPVVSMKKHCIQPSNFALSSNVDIDVNEFIDTLPKQEIFEAVLRTDLSAQLNVGLSVEHRIIKTLWSPPQLVDEHDCVIATLSNTGSLEICVKVFDNSYYEEFVCIGNITQKYIENKMVTWKNTTRLSAVKQFKELKRRVELIRPTAFAWSQIISGNDRFCILVVGHYVGTLSFWKINAFKSNDLSQVKIELLTEHSVNLKYITSISLKEAGDSALLFVGNMEGKVVALQLTNISESNITVEEALVLWSELDQIKVEHITQLTYRKQLFVIVVKGIDLIIYLINDSGKNIDTCVFHVGNMSVTGVQQIGDNKILVLSVTGAIKELKLSCVNFKISIEWKHVYVNINWYINQCLGMVSSINEVFFAFLTGPCKTADTKDDKVLNDLVVFCNTENDALDMLLNNPTRSFRNYWDCLEVVRLHSILDKQFPSIKLVCDVNYDNFSLYKLKLYLWVSKVHETICELTGNVKDDIKSYDDILLMVNIRMAVHRMKYLLKVYESANTLTQFQLQNLNILNNYMKQIVLENLITKLELSNNTVTDIFEVMMKAKELEYPPSPVCDVCGENVIDVSCFPQHFNMQCAISFMHIGKFQKYKCLFCKCVFHEEIEKEVSVIICPFCEVPVYQNRIKLPDESKRISMFCNKDCLKNTLKVSSIEEHAFINENIKVND